MSCLCGKARHGGTNGARTEIMETTDDEQLLMSPGMDATIFFVHLLKIKKEEGEGRLDITEEDEGEAGEDEDEEEEQEEEE